MEPEPDEETRTIMRQVKQQIALAHAQELLAAVTCKCFEKCVRKPREYLTGPEETCIGNCMDRYLDSFRLCANTYGQRLRREQSHQRI